MPSSSLLSSGSSSSAGPVSDLSGAPLLTAELEGPAAPRFDLSGPAVSTADLLAAPEPKPSECLGAGRNEDTGPDPADRGGGASLTLGRRFSASSSSSELTPVVWRIGGGRNWTTRLGFPEEAEDLGGGMEEKVAADFGAGSDEKIGADLGCGSAEKMPPAGFPLASPRRVAGAGEGMLSSASSSEEA